MCAIVGSFDTDKLKELVELNTYRGQHSHSISYYNLKEKTLEVTKKLGPIDIDSINILDNHYGICHIQAPTTDSQDITSIHPANLTRFGRTTALWHNGILKDMTVKMLQNYYATDDMWDTRLLLARISESGDLSTIDGTFSCLWFKPCGQPGQGDLYLFRNEISPMFIDNKMNISSVKFEGSHPTEPNTILRMDLDLVTLVTKSTFTTMENPYHFWD